MVQKINNQAKMRSKINLETNSGKSSEYLLLQKKVNMAWIFSSDNSPFLSQKDLYLSWNEKLILLIIE